MILLTGGSGRLGTELQKYIKCHAPRRNELDILAPSFPRGIEYIIHAAAYTDVVGAETQSLLAAKVNAVGTRNLTKYPIVYISTEYVFDGERGNYVEGDRPEPVNFYGMTKLMGEHACREAPSSLVIRCLFKERPFRHMRACVDQYTTGDYVDVIGRHVAQCIKWFEAGHFADHDTIHIGTARKSTFDLARQTADVAPISLAEITQVKLPRDTSLNTGRFYSMAEQYAHGY